MPYALNTEAMGPSESKIEAVYLPETLVTIYQITESTGQRSR